MFVHRVLICFGLSLASAGSLAALDQPIGYNPAEGAVVGLGDVLAWTSSSADVFDVYLGPSNPPPLSASNVAGARYETGLLSPCTTYYWYVVGKGGSASGSSDVYSFSTGPIATVTPEVVSFPWFGGHGSFSVTAPEGCRWTANLWLPDFVTLDGEGRSPLGDRTGSVSGAGSGTVSYNVAANVPAPGAKQSRMMFIGVGGQAHVIFQDSASSASRCLTRVSGPDFIDSTAQKITFFVTTEWSTTQNCLWGLTPDQSWLTASFYLMDPSLTVLENTTGVSRSGSLAAYAVFPDAIFPAVFTFTQRAAPVTFSDVPLPHPFFDAIGMLRGRRITDGCAPSKFCPDDNITRGQMAVFIVRSIMGGDNFSYAPVPYYNDTPASHQFFKWIQKMRELGITDGCGPAAYCPESPVTRGQMAVFIIRARLGATTAFSYPAAPMFSDAVNTSFFAWIQKMGQLGITSGCGPGSYCPDAPVTRGQMAVFVMRGAFNQLLPGPRPMVVSITPNVVSAGQIANVTITGQNTYFLRGGAVVLAGPGITADSVNVGSATSLTAQIRVATNAAPGPRSITVMVGDEIEATLPNGLRVQ